MSSMSLLYLVTGRCVPEGMVRIDGLDRFLTSIRQRVKHVNVKGSSSNDFGRRVRTHILFNLNSLTLTLEQTSFYPTSSDARKGL